MILLKIALKSKEKQFIFLSRKMIKYLNENESENSEKVGEKTAKNSPSEMSIDKESDVEMEEVIDENNPWLH
jgi:hypothetical protein